MLDENTARPVRELASTAVAASRHRAIAKLTSVIYESSRRACSSVLRAKPTVHVRWFVLGAHGLERIGAAKKRGVQALLSCEQEQSMSLRRYLLEPLVVCRLEA